MLFDRVLGVNYRGFSETQIGALAVVPLVLGVWTEHPKVNRAGFAHRFTYVGHLADTA